MKEIKITYAGVNDAAMLAELSMNTFYDTFAEQNDAENMRQYIEANFTFEKLTAEISDAKSIFVIAVIGDEIAGYAKLRESENPETLEAFSCIEIERLYAVKKFIGFGVGKSLIEKCITIGQQKQKNIIWLGVWEFNLRAIEFYKKFGFEIFGSHPFVLGTDAQTDYLMKLKLMN